MDITRTIEKTDKEIRKVITDENVSREFKEAAELYYNVADVAKRATEMKKNVDEQIINTVKSYFSTADNTIAKALQVGNLLVKVGKDSTRKNTTYDNDKIIDEIKEALPKLEEIIEDIYQKHEQLNKKPTSPRLFIFKKEDREKYKSIIDGEYIEESVGNVLGTLLARLGDSLKKNLNAFIGNQKTVVDDIVDSLKPLTESKDNNMSENEQARSETIDILKEKTNEIEACLKEGVQHEQLHEMLEEYVAASNIAGTADKMKKEISSDLKEEAMNLFDVEDAILNKFIEVGDYVIVVCKDSERVNNKKALEGFVEELKKTIPDYVDVIENIMKTNTDLTEVEVKPRTSVKSLEENIVEALSDKIGKITKYLNGLTKVFTRFLPKLGAHNDRLKTQVNNLFEEVITEESISGDHYCIIQPNFAIFGVGRTEEEAWDAAEEWADTTDENWKNSFEVKPCTKKVFDYVNANGTPDDWVEHEGVVALEDELSEMKEKIEESKL